MRSSSSRDRAEREKQKEKDKREHPYPLFRYNSHEKAYEAVKLPADAPLMTSFMAQQFPSLY